MADKDLKSATPDTSLPTDGFLFGADSQSATDPSVYPVSAVGTTLLGSGTALTGSTVTTSSPVLNLTQTWNGTNSTLLYGAKINISTTPNTTSDLSSPLFAVQINSNNAMVVGATSGVNGGYAFLDLRVNSSSPQYLSATIADNGTTTGIGNGRTTLSLAPTSLIYLGGGATSFRLAATTSFGWSTSPSDTASDLQLTRANTATLQLGAADTTGTTAPTAQFLRVQSWSSSTNNNQLGADFTIQGSRGTGTGAGGSIIFQVAPAGSSGTAQNAYSTALTIASDKSITMAGTSFSTTGAGINFVGGYFTFSNQIYARGTPAISLGASDDVVLYRDAANTLALRNGTSAQLFRVYSTYNGTNDAYGAIGAAVNLDGTAGDANTLYIGSQKKGSPTALTKLAIQVDGTTRIDYGVTNGTALTLTASQVVINECNIRLGDTRFMFWQNRTVLASPADGQLTLWNNAASDFGRLNFGGTTSSFPALKRVSANLQVIAADGTSSAGFIVGNQALVTTATDGFLYIPTCAGTPTGTPTTQTGTAPIVVDTTNNKLYFYSGGQWRDAGP